MLGYSRYGNILKLSTRVKNKTCHSHLLVPLLYPRSKNNIPCDFHTYDVLQPLGSLSYELLRHNSMKNKKPYKFSAVILKAEESSSLNNHHLKAKAPAIPPVVGPACDLRQDSCPPSCHDVCFGPNPPGGNRGENPSKYWKELLLVIILTGTAFFTVTQLSSKKRGSSNAKKEDVDRKWKKEVKNPANSNLIPSEVPYLLIGGGAAAFSAFRSIKSNDPKAKVLIITEESYNPYMRPPLSKEVWYDKERNSSQKFSFRQWHGTPRSFFYEPPEFYTQVDKLKDLVNGGVAVATGWKAKKIDVSNKIVTLDDGYEIKYNKCLLATGSSPKNLKIFESADDEVKRKILPFRTLDDFLELEENVNNSAVRNIIVIGGGFLGSELACSLAQNLNRDEKKIIQVCKEEHIMAQVMPEYLSEWTTRKAKELGVDFIGNTEVENYHTKNGKLYLNLSGNRILEADQVIVAVGAEANTELAKVSELEIDPEIGGYLVNAELEARTNLWVAGDAACFYDIKFGRRRVQHYDNAVISGRLAGENMTGARKPYKHQSMFWSDLGLEVGYEAIGIIDSSLPTVGIFLDKEEKNKDSNKEEIMESVALKAQNVSHDKRNEIGDRNERDFDKGIVFYLKNDIVVGIVLWNIFNRMSIARQVLARNTKYDEITEIAKWFTMHED